MVSKRFSFMPPYIRSLLLRIGMIALLMMLTRVIFYSSNSGAFNDAGISEWISGFWFDLITIALMFLPFIVMSSFPLKIRSNNIYKLIQHITYQVPLLFILAMNLIDTEYFHFTQKRSTFDLFAIVSAGNDVNQLLTTFIKDFWFLIICFIAFAVASIWFYRKTDPERKHKHDFRWKSEVPVFIFILAFTIFIGRGGITLKPVNIIDASLFTEPQNTALVLNTAFTIVKSFGKDDIELKNYFSNEKGLALFNPMRTTEPQQLLPDKTNVVVVMLESFGNEWIGAYNDSTSYTPFLDSLIGESWSFEYGISNGKKSIEAVPSIVASLPSLMDSPYISASYSNNIVESIPSILRKHGYSSGFYHGATNGSMRFNSFAKQLGFDNYYGRKEYNNEKHADATWGILDEYFEPWTARQLTKMKQPFFATLFTLSSHHPYYVPAKWKKVLPKGKYPICQSIAYGDASLRLFFEQAKKEPWYNNTLFVLVADHTPSTSSDYYSQRTQMYRIPIVFYSPTGKLPKKRELTVFQQIDIMPTVFDLLNISENYYSTGNSFFAKQPREGVTYLEGTYYYFNEGKMLVFSNDEPRGLYDFTGKSPVPKTYSLTSADGKRMTARLKAIIQRYNSDLINNQTRSE